MKPQKLIIDLEGNETYVDVTAEELAANKITADLITAKEAEAEAKATARASALAKLAALGLSADEIAAL